MKKKELKKREQRFELLEHKADMGIRGYGESFERAFEECAKGMFSIMTDLKKVDAEEVVELTVKAKGLEELLTEWLNELLSLADQKGMVFSEFTVEQIKVVEGKYVLEGSAKGEKLDKEKHEFKTEVKAATYSGLDSGKEEEEFFVQCVVDV